MALTGSFNHYTWETSNTESHSISISYPATLEVEHVDYEYAGTTQQHWVSSSNVATHSYSSSYVFVQSAAVFTNYVSGEKNQTSLNYQARIYPSQEAKNNDIENYDASWMYDIEWDWDVDTNPMIKAYEHIKSNNPDLTDI